MTRLFLPLFDFLEKFCAPVVLLIIRLWMATIFWRSGVLKISDWQSTLALFYQEYKVPLVPPELAAYLSTMIELACPILLAAGIAARFATLPMIMMVLVIQFTYLDSNEHLYWLMLLGTILCFGPGRLSLDYILRKKNDPLWQ